MLPPALSLSLLDRRAPLHAWRPTKSFLSRQLLDHETMQPVDAHDFLLDDLGARRWTHLSASPNPGPTSEHKNTSFNGDGFYSSRHRLPLLQQGWVVSSLMQSAFGAARVRPPPLANHRSFQPTILSQGLVHITASALPSLLTFPHSASAERRQREI